MTEIPHDFEIRIKGRLSASNREHAELTVRNGLSLTSRIWDAVEDFVIEIMPDRIETLRRIRRDEHNTQD